MKDSTAPTDIPPTTSTDLDTTSPSSDTNSPSPFNVDKDTLSTQIRKLDDDVEEEINDIYDSVVDAHMKRGRIAASFVLVPTFFIEIGSALIVWIHASLVEHMIGTVFVVAFLLSIFALWIYHIAFLLGNTILQWITFFAKICFGGLLAVVTLDHSNPRSYLIGDSIVSIEPSLTLELATGLIVFSMLLLMSHILYFGRGSRPGKRQHATS